MATEGKKIHILIPAYNEEKKIGSVIQSLKENGYHNILVVNDGSTDKTRQMAENHGAQVINLIMNRGQGAALRTGIEHLREMENPDIIVTFDADGQHRSEDIGKIIEPILKDEADIVLGSRFLDSHTRMPILRKAVLKMGVLFTNTVSSVRLTDTHNGFRALGRKAIDSIKITQRGMEHASEIIDEIRRNGWKFKEVPVEIIYSPYSRKKGQKNSGFMKIGLKVIIKKIMA